MTIVAVIGGIIIVPTAIWMLIIAFKESVGWGLCCIFIPFCSLVYVITRWAKMKRPFLISLIGLGLFIVGIVPTVWQFKAEGEPVIREFMKAGAVRDMDKAYACWSSEAITKEEIANHIDKDYDKFFAEYKGVSTNNWSVESKGTKGYMNGTIAYTDGTKLLFEAWLVKKDGVWKITGFTFEEKIQGRNSSGRIFEISPRRIQQVIKKYSVRAGVEATPHTLRHTHIVHSLLNKVTLSAIQKQVGHKRVTTTQKYSELAPEQVSHGYEQRRGWWKSRSKLLKEC